jgi:CBS domain-containing protein
MNVRELLQSKKDSVVTIDVEDTIGAAAHKMSAHKIAALVVMKDDVPVRIISEKDIVRSLADDGPQAGRRVISTLPSAGLEASPPRRP